MAVDASHVPHVGSPRISASSMSASSCDVLEGSASR
jgi:hypothetical protein